VHPTRVFTLTPALRSTELYICRIEVETLRAAQLNGLKKLATGRFLCRPTSSSDRPTYAHDNLSIHVLIGYVRRAVPFGLEAEYVTNEHRHTKSKEPIHVFYSVNYAT
jgi:hypothetical protein